MKDETGGFWEWVIPFSFFITASWVVWHLPAYILTFAPHANESKLAQVTAIHVSKDVSPNLPGLFGGVADIIDWVALILLPILLVLGIRTVKVAHMEFQHWKPIDRIAIFIGRILCWVICRNDREG